MRVCLAALLRATPEQLAQLAARVAGGSGLGGFGGQGCKAEIGEAIATGGSCREKAQKAQRGFGAEYAKYAERAFLVFPGRVFRGCEGPASEQELRREVVELRRAMAELRRVGGRFVFVRSGQCWEVVFGGRHAFALEDTLGARYLNYLLHHPNVPISAFDLECAVRPEKAQARSRDSIQERLDPKAARECLRELDKLRAEQEEARADGDTGRVERLEGEIGALEGAVKGRSRSGDAGERARGNVSHAIAKVVRKLRQGGEAERAFAEHVARFVSLGYEVVYNQGEGREWE